MSRTELRSQVEDVDGLRCCWPGCESAKWIQMAHLRGIGMGGRKSADELSNVCLLCEYHHNLLDGRTHQGLRKELGLLLGWVVNHKRGAR